MPAATHFVHSVGIDGTGPGKGKVLRPSIVIAFIVTPDRRACFVGIVDHITTSHRIAIGDVVINACGEVLLTGDST